MKMKKVSNSRWAMLVFVIVALIVLFNVAGCAMFEEQMANMKGLVGVDSDPIVVETPACDLSCIEDVQG